MSKTRWEKVYQGPFEKEEAKKLAQGLRETAKPDVNLIYDARIRARKGGKQFDVYIKTIKE